MADDKTFPNGGIQPLTAAPHLLLSPSHRDPVNGAVWVHKDMVQVVAPWADIDRERQYIAPVSTVAHFGDVESFAAYVQRYASPTQTFITWNSLGIKAILDYHGEVSEGNTPGRCQWHVIYPFVTSRQLQRWSDFAANGNARGQKEIIEFLEDMADTIVQPTAVELTGVLSMLRATVGNKADSTLNEDGSYAVSYSKEAKLTGKGTIPPTFVIRLPLLHGHTDADKKQVTYDLIVRLRVTPTEQGAVFRLSIPNLAASLEDAWADRVATAQRELASDFHILRASDAR